MIGSGPESDVRVRCRLVRAENESVLETGESECIESVEYYCFMKNSTRTDGQKLSFHPLLRPLPPPRPTSRIKTGRTRYVSPLKSPDSSCNENIDGFKLSNPNLHRRGKGIRSPVRRINPQSPDTTVHITYRTKRTSTFQTTSSASTQIQKNGYHAAACFVTDAQSIQCLRHTEDDKDNYYKGCQPFQVPITDLVTVEVQDHVILDNNSGNEVPVLHIMTKSNGFLELTPHNKHSGDILVAFLQAAAPSHIISNNQSIELQSTRARTLSERSLDMQRFEGSAVEKRFEDEPFLDRMKRRTARVASRFPELCHCCEPPVLDDDNMYMEAEGLNMFEKSHRASDRTAIASVESILTEMELDPGSNEAGADTDEESIELIVSEIVTSPTELDV